MTAPTSPGVVPADVRMLAREHANRSFDDPLSPIAAHIERAIMADRATRPSLAEDERGQVRREALESEVERLRQVAHDLTNAIVQIRPLGGSELYKRFDDQTYFAEPAYCAAAINALRDDVHMLRKENVRLSRALADRSEPRQEKEGKA